jgi:hypothetical protein
MKKKEGFCMRNILVTVMMLIVAVLLFSGIIADDDNGLRAEIESKGAAARNLIRSLEVE